MTLFDLNEEQLEKLAQNYLIEKNPEGVYISELANAFGLVSMKELEKRYGGVTFVEEDF